MKRQIRITFAGGDQIGFLATVDEINRWQATKFIRTGVLGADGWSGIPLAAVKRLDVDPIDVEPEMADADGPQVRSYAGGRWEPLFS